MIFKFYVSYTFISFSKMHSFLTAHPFFPFKTQDELDINQKFAEFVLSVSKSQDSFNDVLSIYSLFVFIFYCMLILQIYCS